MWWIVAAISFLSLVVVWTELAHALDAARRRAPRGTWPAWLLWHFDRLFVRILHRASFHGIENLERLDLDRGLIVVANHTAGVDPALVQAAAPFEIRWMMWSAVNKGIAKWLGAGYLRSIVVDQDGRDVRPLREAIRHVRQGGVLGIFPEGGIERPPHRIYPFRPGVGLIVSHCRAPVLPVWISGTPYTESAMQSVFRLSRSRVVFGSPLEFRDDATPDEIATAIRARLASLSGWPLENERDRVREHQTRRPAPDTIPA
ncbi:MAG: lysophospholipid acyltransferase family protein [Phycisphaerales bacterium]